MAWVLCGLVIGSVMALTGAGGALVSIPLFMQFLGMDLKSASVHSLVAVMMASAVGVWAQRGYLRYRTGLLIVLFSIVGSFLAIPGKAMLPDQWIVLLLTGVSLYALKVVWIPSQTLPENKTEDVNKILAAIVGLGLGVLTTFTGLGGGVLLLPIFLQVFRFSPESAVATSLYVAGLSSFCSLLIQLWQGELSTIESGVVFLALGIIVAVVLIKALSRNLRATTLGVVQQVVFSLVVLFALVKLFFSL